MKCSSCGRGFTWRRIARDAAIVVWTEDGGPFDYCGACVWRDLVDLGELDLVYVWTVASIVDYRLHPDQGVIRRHQLLHGAIAS